MADGQQRGGDTGEYAPTKAPENREAVESTAPTPDARQHPGGAHGAPVPVGMESNDRDTVPSGAAPTRRTNYGEGEDASDRHPDTQR